MTNKQLLTKIRKYRGLIYVGMLVRNDVIWVQALKSHVLLAIEGVEDDGAMADERDGALYITNN